MKRIIVSGFEDTLIDDNEAINMKTMLEIDRVRTNKYLFAVVTSNGLDYVLPYNKDFPFLDFILFFDGRAIYDVKLNKLIYKSNINYSIIKVIVDNFFDSDIYVYTAFEKIKINNLSDISDYKRDILRIDILSDKVNEISKRINSLNLNITVIKDSCIKIYSNCSRDIAIEKLCFRKKINIDGCYVIGGNENDLEMIKKYNGVCVGNATKKIKRISRDVMICNDSLGVCEFLSKFS